MIHASYVYDFLEASKPDAIFVQQSPDVPLFIKTKSGTNFHQKWFEFVRTGNEARFLVSSLPKYTSDLLLNKKKLVNLMEQNIMPAKQDFDFSTKILYSKQRSMVDHEIRPDSMLTPLLYAYN
jgi:hypothetical protein